MKINRPSLPPKRLTQSLLFSPVPKRPGPSVPRVQSRSPKRRDERSRPHREDEYAPECNALFIPSSPWSHRLSLHERLFGRMPHGWVISARAETHSLAAVAIKIETGLMDLSLRSAEGGQCIPCHMSIRVVGHSRTIPEWRLFGGVALEQATLKALNSRFEKVPGSVSMCALEAQRYRYRGTDYEAAALRNGNFWLRLTGSSDWSTAFGRRWSPRRAQERPTIEALLSLLRARARTEGARVVRNQLMAQWIDRQPKVIRELVSQVFRGYGKGPERPTNNVLTQLVFMQLVRINESRPLSDRLKKPGRATLYRWIHHVLDTDRR